MIERFITASFRAPLVALILVLAGAGLGGTWLRELPRDVFPDLSAPVFNVVVQNPAMGPEELETRVTIPVETALSGLPDVRRIRSASTLGVSQVTIEFEPDAAYGRARQRVAERLTEAALRVWGVVQQALQSTFGAVTRTLGFALAMLVIPFWLFYILNDTGRFMSAMMGLIPHDLRPDVEAVRDRRLHAVEVRERLVQPRVCTA
mgnify:CR=1 FL=1